MASEEKEQKAISLPTFSGKKKDFNIWWKRFNAYATMKNFAMDRRALPPPPRARGMSDEGVCSVFDNHTAVR